MRKSIVAALLPLTLCLFQSVFAGEDADTVINRYLEAMGGRAKLEQLHSRVLKARFDMPDMGISASMEEYLTEPDMYLSRTNFTDFPAALRGVNGNIAWEINPMAGPRVVTGAERSAYLRNARIEPLLNWKQNFAQAEVGEDATVEGQACTKLVLTDADGGRVSFFIDKGTNLIARMEQTLGGQSVQANFSDYRTIDGVKVPFKMNMLAGQFGFAVTVDSVEFNTEIGPEKFELPAEIKSLVQ